MKSLLCFLIGHKTIEGQFTLKGHSFDFFVCRRCFDKEKVLDIDKFIETKI